MFKRWEPILTLIFITPFLTELLTTNIPAPKFFQPLIFILLATVGYGFPVLLIRELAHRLKLTTRGIFLIGFAYGIYNEGILAKTLFLKTNVPLPVFNDYGYFFGINFTWLIFICIWHALFSVSFPLGIVRYLYPNARDKQWLSPKLVWLISVFAIIPALLIFFNIAPNGVRGNVIHLIFLLLIIFLFLGLALLSSKRAESIQEGRNSKSFALGTTLVVFSVLVPILLARIKIPILLFICYEIIVAWFYVWFVMNKKINSLASFVLFALGSEIGLGLFGLVSLLKKNEPVAYIVHMILLFVLSWAAYRVKIGFLKNKMSG